MGRAIVDLFRYNKWANLELFEFCRGLSEEQLSAKVPGTFGTIRSLLMHIVGGQETFINRTRGSSAQADLSRVSSWPGIERVIDVAISSSDGLIAIAESITDDEMVDLPWQGKVFRFPKAFFLTHALEHGMEHRTEIKVTLATLGVQTPDLDGWPYSAAAGYGEVVG